ncbi:MAG: hypothetical protein WCA46_20420, partial [Actinocatenispora sp.]
MSARDRRRRGLVPTTLFWVGAALAPLAGIVLWFAEGGGPLRAAAVLAILGTVLVGLSVVLRRDPDAVRLDLQENLLAEMDALRTDLGEALTTAAQNSNQALAAEVAELQQQVDSLTTANRRRAEVLRGEQSGT